MAADRQRTPRLPASERRRQLLDAALELLATEGFDAVNVEAVARRAGVTRPVVYDQFGDLDGLLVALVDREEATALAPLGAILDDPEDADPDRFLVEGVRAFLRAVRSAPRTWRLVLMPPDGGSADLRERVQRSRAAITGRVQELLAWGIERRGGPHGIDVDLLARLVVALGEDGARLVVAHPRRYSPDRLAELVERLVALVPRDGSRAKGSVALVRVALPQARAVPAASGRVPRAERREQLLDHALALVGEDGFDALNVEALARRAAVNRVVVYRSFSGVPGLLLALMRREQARVRGQLDALVPTEPADRTPYELLTETLAGFLELVTEDVLTWRVALLRPESAPTVVQKVVARQRTDLAQRLRPLVLWGLEGLPLDVPEDDADLLARLLLTVAEELGRTALEAPTFPRARLVDSVARFLALLPWAAAPAR